MELASRSQFRCSLPASVINTHTRPPTDMLLVCRTHRAIWQVFWELELERNWFLEWISTSGPLGNLLPPLACVSHMAPMADCF
jgi:hypothetical protein